ncbi:hepatocyte cell adhesion molecule-like isoform X14 [Cuculus canorus]|uniref:hepatocyte cell adhesion molecule-like isoform X14 n=1 Tax=Cuculus canorus TaxID=55661 RepID=UPI0023AAA72B|nr:hepatocyte cell adhesion molecule-like isoform X14 [Cuculus canorus]
MLTQLQAAITGYLLLILQVSFAMVEITEKRYAVEGSSILMHAPDIKNISFIQWEYLSPTSSALILQHYADSQSLTIYPAYQGRVTFYQKNGSILLQGLEETDSGTYKATVDLMQDKARTTLLKVIKPVPQPELQCTSNLAGSPIELVCLVPEGVEVFSISWKKDGRPLPAEKCYLLSENITVLWIRNGEKSDCGTYSCNISNMISWKEATLNLMVTGLTPPLHHAQRLVIVALMFTTVSAISFIIQLFHRRSKETHNSVCPWIFVHLLSPSACCLHHLDAGRRFFCCLHLACPVLPCWGDRKYRGCSSSSETRISKILQNRNMCWKKPEDRSRKRSKGSSLHQLG